MSKIGLYCPSYNRWNEIKTKNIVPSITYVVRKSQEDFYREAGVDNIWAVEDDKINSWCNVMNYIIDNSKEELITIMDDDISTFYFVTDEAIEVKDSDVIENEFVRNLNVMNDLDIGFGALFFNYDPKVYNKEIQFSGTLGSVYFFNKKTLKARFKNEAYAVADAELELQELLVNRIVYLPRFFKARADYNSGSNTQSRTTKKVTDSFLWTKLKWGKYFVYDEKKLKTKIKVDR